MNTDYIKGVIVPIITVIDADEKIDEAGMRRQVEFVIKGGLHGILAFGSNGEFYQIEEDAMEVARVMYLKSNYMRRIFGEIIRFDDVED